MDKSDSFVIDMESFSHGTDKDITPNSRVSVPPKEKVKWKMMVVINYHKLGSSTPKSPLAMGTIDHSSNPQVHHQITVTAANIAPPRWQMCCPEK
ncbi:hypothetical protein Prudu_010840 [Prunus dulcis]|uniref:Uncharacterized protein n=1 Tax=Prunus dulcis TaxID=3755 RepID=A0A4Y1R9Z7_PRUDU|nr:hypothetical protein Prudu_010840 [Prunus dulcis]